MASITNIFVNATDDKSTIVDNEFIYGGTLGECIGCCYNQWQSDNKFDGIYNKIGFSCGTEPNGHAVIQWKRVDDELLKFI